MKAESKELPDIMSTIADGLRDMGRSWLEAGDIQIPPPSEYFEKKSENNLKNNN